jgi:transcriptional regulator of acetoin/glycerol metabolism
LISRVFIDEGNVIIVELPTYLAALNAFTILYPQIVGIPVDENGMRTDILEKELKRLQAEEIHLKLKELRSEERTLRDELIREAIRLRAYGLTIAEVVKLTGIPRSTLYRRLP